MIASRPLTRLSHEHALTHPEIAALASVPLRQPIRTVKDLLDCTSLELAELCDWGPDHAERVTRKVSRAVCPDKKTVLSLLTTGAGGNEVSANPQYLATSIQGLDKALLGGIPCSSITEVVGPAGCGKTQLCTTLAVLATLPRAMGGLDGGVAYVDTEGSFSPQRLMEIARSRFPEHFASSFPSDRNPPGNEAHDPISALSESVHILRVKSSKELVNSLGNLQNLIISERIRLVIIDSVAAVVRKDFGGSSDRDGFNGRGSRMAGGELKDRSDLLGREAGVLKYLAESFNIPIVVTNQITTRFYRTGMVGVVNDGNQRLSPVHGGPQQNEFTETQITAALGNTWSHAVNTRLILEFRREEQQQSKITNYLSSIAPEPQRNADSSAGVVAVPPRVRNLHIAKSPVAPFLTFECTVNQQGFVGYRSTPTSV